MQAALSATPAALAVELNPASILKATPPEPLTRENAELLAAIIGEDLQRILGQDIAQTGMVMPAGLYDLTEVLRPGLPMVEMMLDLYRGSLRGGAFAPQLLALGSSGGRFALPALAPQRKPGAGPLLLVPFALVAPGPQIDAISHLIEQDLLEKGKAALQTDRAIRQLFGVEPINLTYASFNDISAMLKVQLEYVGFEPLWSLLEAALYQPDAVKLVDTAAGNRLITHGGEVFAPFQSFDHFSAQQSLAGSSAINAYETWLKTQRQYIALLTAHGLETRISHSPEGVFSQDAEVALSVAQAHVISSDEKVYRETIMDLDLDSQRDALATITLTEQWSHALGPVAITILIQDKSENLLALIHEYPLDSSAINWSEHYWREMAAECNAQFYIETPKKMIINGKPAKLHPWLEYQGQA